eukprot:COSAG02_NODE_6779_length_3365_cov_1.424066_1_plen_395_part_00
MSRLVVVVPSFDWDVGARGASGKEGRWQRGATRTRTAQQGGEYAAQQQRLIKSSMTKSDCLKGTVICISGALSVPKAEMTAVLKGAGATVASSFTAKVTHVLSTPADAAKGTTKVKSAEAKGLPVVGESFVDASIKAGKRASEKSHLLTSGAGPKKTIAKKSKGAAKTKKPAAAEAAAADENESKGPTVLAVSQVGGDDAAVCVDEDGAYLEAQLSQIEVKSNTDKFYTIQVVRDDSSDEYFCVAHWGRTGTKGDSKVDGPFDSLADAVAAFEAKFKAKAGVVYSKRTEYTPKAKKYAYKHVNYCRVAEGSVMWQYWVDDFVDGKQPGWYDYFAEASEGVDAVWQEWQSNTWLDVRCIASGNWTYKVDFNTMTQENTATSKVRTIRRTVDGEPR